MGSSSERERREYEDWHPALTEHTHLDTLVRRCERQEYPDTIVQRLSTVGMFSPTHLDVVVLNMSPAEHAYFQQRMLSRADHAPLWSLRR
jgi:hypothetical protein